MRCPSPLSIAFLTLILCAGLSGCDPGSGSVLPPAFDLTPRGSIQVRAETSGQLVPEDGYRVTIVPGSGVDGSEQSAPLGPNGTVTFAGLRPGSWTVSIAEVPARCAIDGSLSRQAVVEDDRTTEVRFTAACDAVLTGAVRAIRE